MYNWVLESGRKPFTQETTVCSAVAVWRHVIDFILKDKVCCQPKVASTAVAAVPAVATKWHHNAVWGQLTGSMCDIGDIRRK